MIFKGSATALITPFTRDNKVDFARLKELIDFQIKGGTDAIVVLGTTGEASTININEKLEIVECAVEHAIGRVPIIAGSGANDTEVAVKNSKLFDNMGVNGLLVVTPYYNKSTQHGLIQHYLKIADNVDSEIVLYNVPGRTGVNILPSTVKVLSEHENITAIKEASGNIEQIAEIKRICDIGLYSGDDALTFLVLALGGDGVVSVASNIVPDKVSNMCKKYFDNDIEGARQLQFEINSLIKLLFSEVNPIPVKKAAELMALCDGYLRMPLTEMTKENTQLLMQEMQKHNLLT